MALMLFQQQQITGNFNSFNSNNSPNKIVNFITEIDLQAKGYQILRWLSLLE